MRDIGMILDARVTMSQLIHSGSSCFWNNSYNV